jgi:signal transduction histidine kinase
VSSHFLAASLDDDRRVRLERVLALARLGLAFIAILLVHADLQPPGVDFTLGVTLVWSYTLFALTAAILVALLTPFIGPLSVHLHVLDVAWILAITPLSDRPATIFFVVSVYAVIGAGFRWGQKATVLTGLVTGALLIVEGALPPIWPFGGVPTIGPLAARAAYVVGMACLIGALAEEQHQARRRAATMARVLATVSLAGGLRASMRPLLAELTAAFGARRAALAVKEVMSGRLYLWDLPARDGEVRLSELDEDRRAIWWAPLPGTAAVRLAERRGERFEISYEDRVHGADATAAGALHTQLASARRALIGEWQISHEWAGRLFLYDPTWSTHQRGQRWLASMLPQIGPGLYSLYLLGRLRSRATAMERARIARELHDGVIQQLVGLEMHVETLRRELEKSSPAAATELQAIRETLRASALNTRDLMQQLKPVDLGVGDLPGQLASAADRFRRDTSIDTRFVCDLNDVQIAPRVGREILRIAQEALVNVRKHSGARHVLLGFGAEGDRWRLTIDDDGKGFEFDGRYSLDQLDADRRGPVVIKERVRGLGGTMTVDSAPGRGTRLEIDVPRSGR